MIVTVGIDLGTCNSSLACVVDGALSLIPNCRGRHATPSVLAYLKDGQILVGESAQNQALLQPQAMVRESKRYMGQAKIFETPQGPITAEAAAEVLLSRMRKDASDYLMQEAHKAVIAVPAHFSDQARRSTLRAAKAAGWDSVRLLNEPTAAAFPFFERSAQASLVLVYDFGGGTFDVSLVRRQGRGLRVLASEGMERLGGSDLTQALAFFALEKNRGESPAALPGDPGLAWRLLHNAEQAKIDLSQQSSAYMGVPDPEGSARDVVLELSRQEIEPLFLPFIQKTVELCSGVLKQAGISPADLDAVLLSGGSSRIPLVRDLLARSFPGVELKGLNPDEAVALGCACFGNALESGNSWTLEDVTGYDLGLLVEEREFYPLINRNSPIPTRVRRTFTTQTPGQETAELKILQRDAELHELGLIEINAASLENTGSPLLDVIFSLDENEVLQVDVLHSEDTLRSIRFVPAGRSLGPELFLRIHQLGRELENLVAAQDVPSGLRVVLKDHLSRMDGINTTEGLSAMESELSVYMAEARAWVK